MDSLLLIALIFLVAFLYSSVGHAGASGYLAVMSFTDLKQELAKPTATSLNILVATIGTIQFARAGHLPWKQLWPFALGSIPFAFLGGRQFLTNEIYRALVGLVLLAAALRLSVFRATAAPKETKNAPIPVAILLGVVIGFLSGLTGTGGGIFLTPLLLLMGWAEPKKAAGISVTFILVNSIAGLLGQLQRGIVLAPEAGGWFVAATVGGLLGSSLGAWKFPADMLRKLLAVVLLIASFKLLKTWIMG